MRVIGRFEELSVAKSGFHRPYVPVRVRDVRPHVGKAPLPQSYFLLFPHCNLTARNIYICEWFMVYRGSDHGVAFRQPI